MTAEEWDALRREVRDLRASLAAERRLSRSNAEELLRRAVAAEDALAAGLHPLGPAVYTCGCRNAAVAKARAFCPEHLSPLAPDAQPG